jgi:hypothetical protein
VVKGDDIVSEVHRQIFPVIVVEDDRPEHKLLAGERLAWGQFLLAAQGVGITGYVGLRNPAGSGVILVVEEYYMSTPATKYYVALGRAIANLTAQGTEQPRDTRLQAGATFGVSAPNITGQLVSGRSDTITPSPFVVAENINNTTSSSTPNDFNRQPVVLAPGDTLFLFRSDGAGGTITNGAVQANFAWRERSTEPGETA